MRFRELRLQAYGPFSDVTLEFGRGLHMIYGPNEAGKSTALRAITGLLYGIPARTVDAHVHDNKMLRVGGIIEHGDGQVLDVVRRKGRKRTLLDREERPLDDALMSRALAGVSRALFVTMFGLDHVSLRDGAQALLRGDGDVGETLFDAGGARGIGQVLDELHAEAHALYKPRATNPLLNEALKRFRESKVALEHKELLPGAWIAQREGIDAARAEHADWVGRRQRLGAERNRLQRALRALPHLAKRRDVLTQLDALGPVPPLPEEARTRRLDAQRERDHAMRRIADLDADIAKLEAARDEIAMDRALAEIGDEVIGDISDRLGNHKKAQRDLPKRESQLADRKREVVTLLREVGRDVTYDDVHSLRLDRATRARIDSLRTAFAGHVAERDVAVRALDEARAKHRLHAGRLEAMKEVSDVHALREAVARTMADRDLEAELAALGGERQRLVDDQTRLEALVGAILSEAPPSRGDVGAARQRAEALAREAEALNDKGRDIDDRARRTAADLDELSQLGAPSAAELHELRNERDRRWRAVVAATREGTEADLAGHEEDVAACDRMADRMWQQADRVAKRARLAADQKMIAREREALKEARDDHTSGRRAHEMRWAEMWARVDSPPSMEAADDWLDHHDALTHLGEELARVETALNVGEQRRDAHLKRLAAWVDGEGGLRNRIERAEAHLQCVEEEVRAREVQARAVAELEERIVVLEQRHAATESALSTWRSAWGETMAVLGLGAEATVEEAQAVEAAIGELFERVREADELERRVEGIRRDAMQFAAVVDPLVSELAPELGEEPLERAATKLVARHREARAAGDRWSTLDTRAQEKRAQLDTLVQQRSDAEHVIADLVHAAGAESEESLEGLEERTLVAARLRQALNETEQALFAEGSIDELETLTRDLDVDAARERAAELEDEHRVVMDRCEQLSSEIGAKETGMRGLENREGAARAAVEREEALAGVVAHAERFVRLRLAAVVLEREIESYRQKNQGPILTRASELFPRLTLGNYVGLSVRLDDKDEPAIHCTRVDGSEVGVGGLSDGVRDQLYLALRLASLERYGQRCELLPFVVDDVLIHFDDDRARAALQVLAELSDATQVLFFTHHARLVELAKDLDGVVHHALPSPAERRAG